MLPTTGDAVKAMLKADPSLTPADRTQIMAALRNHGKPDDDNRVVEKPKTRILQRKEVARRFNRSLRFVDKLAVEGILPRAKMPGRIRACGYREEDVERLMAGEGETASLQA